MRIKQRENGITKTRNHKKHTHHLLSIDFIIFDAYNIKLLNL
jgi:hypothetical protein